MRRRVEGAAQVEVGDFAAFLRLRERWDELIADNPLDAPFLRHDFTRLWIENFASPEQLSVWTVRRGGHLSLALPLLKSTRLFRGLPARVWRAPVNVHACRFDLIAPARDLLDPRDLESLLDALMARRDVDVIELADVPCDGSLRLLFELACARGLPTFAWPSMETPWIDLGAGEERLPTSSHFRANLRRRRKKLEALGPLTLQRCVGGSALEALLEEGFQIERQSWKGRERTAIACSPRLRAFYSEWARSNALSGQLSLYFLRLGERAIAFHYGIASGQTYYLPKVGFDEALGDCSPGQVLMDLVVRDLIQRGTTRFDFLGPSMAWKRDWTRQTRPHHWLYLFADTRRGRLLRWLKSLDVGALVGRGRGRGGR